MSKPTSRTTSKESMWRDRFKRQASSGKSMAAFCRDESIPVSAFYTWRSKLLPGSIARGPVPTPAAADFIDLGAVSAQSQTSLTSSSKFELRINLGDGFSLTISKN